jgi:hypothetical protein
MKKKIIKTKLVAWQIIGEEYPKIGTEEDRQKDIDKMQAKIDKVNEEAGMIVEVAFSYDSGIIKSPDFVGFDNGEEQDEKK